MGERVQIATVVSGDRLSRKGLESSLGQDTLWERSSQKVNILTNVFSHKVHS